MLGCLLQNPLTFLALLCRNFVHVFMWFSILLSTLFRSVCQLGSACCSVFDPYWQAKLYESFEHKFLVIKASNNCNIGQYAWCWINLINLLYSALYLLYITLWLRTKMNRLFRLFYFDSNKIFFLRLSWKTFFYWRSLKISFPLKSQLRQTRGTSQL